MHAHVRNSRLAMRRILIALVALMAAAATPSWALLSTDYQFSVTNQAYTPLAGPTLAIAGTNTTVAGGGQFNDTANVGPFNIGFSFQFDCLAYTQFSVSTSGTIFLGSQRGGTFNNDLANAPRYPIIAPWWDHQHLYNGGGVGAGCNFNPLVGVHYQLSGTAPNRVLTIEFNTQVADVSNALWWAGCGLTMNRYQARLYEGTNVIEFHYGSLWASSGQATAATIGIANGTTNFLSVTPTGATGTVSSVTSNNTIAQHVALIPAGTVHRFVPCYIRRTGTAGLASVAMAPGDTLLAGQSVMMGNEASYGAFSLSFPSGVCPDHNYTVTISGAAATDYRFSSTGNQTQAGTISAGGSITPTIIFRPTATGIRPAFMTVTDNTIGCSIIFYLTATGTQRFAIAGNPAEGGTVPMNNNDTLLKGLFGIRGSSTNFMPFTVSNLSTMDAIPAMNVTYTITGGAGQYVITPPNAAVGSSQTSTPTITFTPTPSALGPQIATLTVAADGITRTYTLCAVAAFPELRVTTGGTVLDSSSTLFTNMIGCVGEQAITIPLDFTNPNFMPDTIWGIDIYKTDTVFRQGSPRYPLARDGSGNLIPMDDYVLSTAPGVAPAQSNPQPIYPIIINPGQSQRYYLTFVAQRHNRRFGRMFLRTNALNLVSPDTNGLNTAGILRLDLFARGIGGVLSGNSNGGRPQPIVFPVTPIGMSVDTTFMLWNTGQCDLRISLPRFSIETGDVDEFEIVSAPNGTTDPVTGDLLLLPGQNTSVRVRFTPVQVQSRRASIRVQTSDSTIDIPGITERGVHYIDLYGAGKEDLYAEGADLGTALIGGDATEHTHGVARLENAQNGPMIITAISIFGVDSLEFNPDPAKPWPARLPHVLQGGKTLELGIVFAPRAGGQPGPRNAVVRILTLSGDTLWAPLTAVAGTRTIEVAPTSLTFGPISVGKVTRQMFVIRNTGTMNLKVTPFSAPPGTDFTTDGLVRTNLAPGQEEFIEVSYEPTAAGQSNATIDIVSNGTNGTQQVALNGTAVTRAHGKDDPSIAGRGIGADFVRNGLEEFSVSGVSGVRDASGLALLQSVPNPARDVVEIGYILPTGSEVVLALYDASGRLVRTLDAGIRQAGERRLRIDVGELANGVYHYRLTSAGHTLSRTLTVVK